MHGLSGSSEAGQYGLEIDESLERRSSLSLASARMEAGQFWPRWVIITENFFSRFSLPPCLIVTSAPIRNKSSFQALVKSTFVEATTKCSPLNKSLRLTVPTS